MPLTPRKNTVVEKVEWKEGGRVGGGEREGEGGWKEERGRVGGGEREGGRRREGGKGRVGGGKKKGGIGTNKPRLNGGYKQRSSTAL